MEELEVATEPKKKKFPLLHLIIPVLVLWMAGLSWGFWYIYKAENASLPPPSGPRIDPNYQPPKSLDIIVESPQDGVIIVDNELLVKGKALPQSSVVAYTESDEVILETDANGNFEGKVGVVPGINTLTFTSFSSDGEEKSVYLDVVYDES